VDRRPYYPVDGPLEEADEVLALNEAEFDEHNQHIDITVPESGRTVVYKRLIRNNGLGHTRYQTIEGRWVNDTDDTTPRVLVFIGWTS
jgi:hypothetical protein